jgi:hypothetical protein
MKIYSTLVVIAVFPSLASCEGVIDSFLPIIKPAPDQLTWVAHFYSGGVQCDSSSHYVPPDVELVLTAAGVAVFETTVEPYAVCAACGCPSYAAMHYAQIKRVDLSKAEEIGFQEKNPPQRP